MQNWLLRLLVIGSLAACFSCATQKKLGRDSITALRFVGEYTVPNRLPFKGTTVGGLSSIDYNPADSLYYLICDDRSAINPSRFYTARIEFSDAGIDTVQFVNVHPLLQRNGQPFPPLRQDSVHVTDPEGLRVNWKSGQMVWSSEGERILSAARRVLINPSLTIASLQGRYIDTFPLPPNLYVTDSSKGPRQNGVFEGLTFTPDFKWMYVALEEPLLEDGPRAGLDDTTGWIRIIKYNVSTKKPVAQFAYQIDAVVREPAVRKSGSLNGVPDLLAINNHQLLITERSYTTGYSTCNVRLYLAEMEGAQNIMNNSSLVANAAKKPVQKKLLFNLDSLGRWIDTVEGATFGPAFSNGKRSLLLVTDDNFSSSERTQLLLFEVH